MMIRCRGFHKNTLWPKKFPLYQAHSAETIGFVPRRRNEVCQAVNDLEYFFCW